MALKLFKPREVNEAVINRNDRDLERAAAIHKVSKEVLEESARAEKVFEETMDRSSKAFQEEEAKRRNILQALLFETELLEKRKAEALSPIITREEAVHNREGELDTREAALGAKESEFEERVRAYMAHLDQLSEREEAVKHREIKQKAHQKGIDQQAEDVRTKAKALSQAQSSFMASCQVRASGLSMAEQAVKAQADTNIEYRKTLDLKAEEQGLEAIRLADLRYTLEKGFKELEKLKKNYG